eukprot:UN14553
MSGCLFVHNLVLKLDKCLHGDSEIRVVVFPQLSEVDYNTSKEIQKQVYDKNHTTKISKLTFSYFGVFTVMDATMETKTVGSRELCEILQRSDKVEECVSESEFET